MSANKPLLREIEAFIRGAGIAESTFGLQAVNDGKFVRRLRNGGRIFQETEDRVRTYISDYKPPTRAKRKEVA